MPLYEYECEKGHRIERYARVSSKGEPLPSIGCNECSPKNGKIVKAHLVASKTGTPRFKAGVGGFFKPNA